MRLLPIFSGMATVALVACSASQTAPTKERSVASSSAGDAASAPRLVRGSPSASVSQRGAQGGGSGRSAASAPPSRLVAERECQGKLVDSAVTPVGVAMQFKAGRTEGGKQMEIREEAGCLVFEVQMSITRTRQVWAIYEVLERFADGGERVLKVVDPPGAPCPFPECDPGFDLAKLPADCARERVGSTVEDVGPVEFPIRLEYQVIETNPEQMRAEDMWQVPEAEALVLETQGFDVAQSIEKIKFCHKDLTALLDADRFPCWLVVRAVPGKGGNPKVVFSQNPLTRKRVEEALRHIEDAPAARDEP